jgi:Ca2+-binding RTX toxin-like protein
VRPRRGAARRRPLSIPAILAATVAVSAVVGLTAANSVATSRAEDSSRAVTADELKPATCAGVALSSVVVGSNGTNGNNLLIGSTAADTLDGNQGNDCVLGGGGNDSLRGSQGTDVCIGGPGTDSFHPSCETQVQ